MADPIKLLSLCSGVGMLDEGVALGLRYLGYDSRVVGYCERDSFAAACLLARMEDASLEPAPVWCGNLEDVAWSELRGHVDGLVAGFSCQPHSTAGKRQSTADERWIWPAIADAVRQVEPRWIFLENVRGFLSSGDGAACGEVLRDVARLGFDAEWTVLSAAAVKASHKRERWFCLAYRKGERFGEAGRRDAGLSERACGSVPNVAHANGQRRQQITGSSSGDETADGRAGRDGSESDADNEPASADATLGDTQHGTPGDGRTNGKGGSQGRKRRRVRGPVKPSGVLGDTECNGGRIDEQGRGSNRGSTNRRSGAKVDFESDDDWLDDILSCGGTIPIEPELQRWHGNVGDTDGSGRREDSASRIMANAEQPGPQGQRLGEPQRRGEPLALYGIGGADSQLFAPGPGFIGWPRILEAAPWLTPAVEPGFRLLADGMAVVLDASRADQLRCGGNGVVALCAAAAFVGLVRRVNQHGG